MKWILRFIIGLYLISGLAIYFAQSKLILWPDPIPEHFDYGVGEEIDIEVADNISINNVLIKSGPSSKGVIMYFHGNKGNVRRAIYQLKTFQNLNYDIFITDYRGYGKSEGSLSSDKALLSDANTVYQYIKGKYSEDKIYLLGYSLGTGIASYVASLNNPKHLFLVAPFTSITDIKDKYLWFYPDFLLRFQLPVKRFLNSVKCPVSIVHGTQDDVVDYQYSQELKELFPTKVELITSKGQSHRGIIFDPLLSKEIRRVLSRN